MKFLSLKPRHLTPLLVATVALSALAYSGCNTSSDDGGGDSSGDSGTTASGSFSAVTVADTQNHQIIGSDDFAGDNWISFALPNNGTPANIAFDWNFLLYISDTTNNTIIQMADMFGTGLTAFGSTGTGQGQFNTPRGIAFDASNRVYVVDSGNNRIVRMDDITGANWTSFGALGNGVNQFNSPVGIGVDPNGRIYVTDTGNNRVVTIDDMSGTNWTVLAGSGADTFSSPTGLTLDIFTDYITGNTEFLGFLVADTGNNRVVYANDNTGAGWTPFGTTGSGTNQFTVPQGVSGNGNGSFTIADTGNSRLVRIDAINGLGWSTYGAQGSGANQFNLPQDVSAYY